MPQMRNIQYFIRNVIEKYELNRCMRFIHKSMKVHHLTMAKDVLWDYVILDHSNLNNIMAFDYLHSMMQNLILEYVCGLSWQI